MRIGILEYLGFDSLENIHGSVYIKIVRACSTTETKIKELIMHLTSSTTNYISVDTESCGGNLSILIIHFV